MVYYAVTIKENTVPIDKLTEQFYEDWFYSAQLKGLKCIKKTFEYDDKWRLHCHAICTSEKRIYKKKFLIYSYHQNIEELKDSADIIFWMIYMYKDYTYDRAKAQFKDILEHGGIQMEQRDSLPSQEGTKSYLNTILRNTDIK